MTAGQVVWICFGALLGFIIIEGLQDFKLFKIKGEQLYAFKSTNRDRYLTLIIQGTCIAIMIIEYVKGKMYVPIGAILCMALSCSLVCVSCFKKSGFYEQIISINGIYYPKERIKSYYWTNYVMQSENSGLMLEITNLLNKKKTTALEVTIPKIDRKKIEMILADYGIKRVVDGENITNLE